MLRTLALGLGVANALLLAAQFGVYERLLGRPDAQEAQREPARLQRQLHPEVLQVLTPQAASAALAAAAASAAASSAGAAACLEAGPFSGTEAEAAERTLRDAGLPPASWQALRTEDGGAYLVYMGRYADRETLQRKLEEVKRRKVEVEEIRGAPELQPGLSLGRHPSKAAADAALASAAKRGVRTARVVTLRPAQAQLLLRVPLADATLRARLAGLRLPSGPGFVACNAAASDGAAAAASEAAAQAAPAPGAGPSAPRAPASAGPAPSGAARPAAAAPAGPAAASARPPVTAPATSAAKR